MFNPKEFELESNYSDDSITKSLKKKKESKIPKLEAEAVTQEQPACFNCSKPSHTGLQCSKRNLFQENGFNPTSSNAFQPEAILQDPACTISQVQPFMKDEFENSDINDREIPVQFEGPLEKGAKRPDIPFKRKYHRLYEKKQNQEIRQNLQKRNYPQDMREDLYEENPQTITQENIRKMQLKKCKSNERKYLGIENYQDNEYGSTTARQPNLPKEFSRNSYVGHQVETQPSGLSNAAKSFRKFRSNLYKKMDNQNKSGYSRTNSAIDSHISGVYTSDPTVLSRSNSVSGNSAIYEGNESRDNSPISYIDSNTSRLEQK